MGLKIRFRRYVWVLLDILLVNLAVYTAYLIRGTLYFDSRWKNLLMEEYIGLFWQITLVVVVVRICIFYFFSLYKPVWRYAGIDEFLDILKAVTLGTGVFIVIMYVSRQLFYSRGVVAIDWVLNLIFISLTRLSSRVFYEYKTRASSGPSINALIVGAGNAGQNTLRDLRSQTKKHYIPVGFVDEDLKKQGKSINGVEVVGTKLDIPETVHLSKIDEIFITASPAYSDDMKELISSCEATGAKVNVVPDTISLFSESTDSKKVLVIGGAGYIGSVMVRKLLQRGYRVRVLDSLLYGEESISELYDNPGFELIVGDFRHVDTVVRSVRGVDAVIHLGGIVGDPACQLDPEFSIEVNAAATRMIKDVCTGFGIKRFIFSSTCSVYGASNDILDEESLVKPLSVYARSKVDSERILLNGSNGSLSPTIFRMATVFGLSHRPRFDLVLNLLTAKAAQGEDITIFGGYQWRPFIHVDDVAKAFITCLESPLDKVGRQVFNVGDDSLNCQISKLGYMISDLLPGSKVKHHKDLTDERNYRVSFGKIKETLNFRCDRTIQDGVSEIRDAIQNGLIEDYRDARFSNYLWLERQPKKREILFTNSHYE
ncbi:NAD-dependent epimerase/dehydratase family protein [Candidatus Poribacteria bacterium]|nr:NAD-dependent epimerase/dehydratase family protein [Candidatus Poribacteria bacterium]